ncbi:MAG: recombinase family protein [Anaerolineae bacterium]
MGKRTALYIRVSSSLQEDDGSSLATQEEYGRRYASSKGYHIDESHIYREVHTGLELWERPQLTRLREQIRRRAVDVVVVYAIDRLSRDPVHLGVILSEAEHAGVAVEFVAEPFDDSPEGQLVRFVRGYAAKVEHEKFRERSQRGKLARVQSGKLMHAWKPLYGYQWRDSKKAAYDIDPATAPIVRRIFNEAVSGRSLRQIAQGLTDEGIPTPTGRRAEWRPNAISEILHHRAYTGEAYAWRLVVQKENGNRHIRVRPEEEWIALPDGTIPLLVDLATWEAAQAILAENKERAGRYAPHPETHLLRRGYAICGYCGAAMNAGIAKGGKPYYYCGRQKRYHHECPDGATISGTILDAAVWERVEKVLTQPDVITRELARLHEADPTTADLTAVDKALADSNRKQANLVRRLADFDDEAVADAIKKELNTLAAQKRQLEKEKAQILTRRTTWEAAQAQITELEKWCRQVAERLDDFSYEQRRLALQALGIQVLVFRESHDPRYIIKATIPLTENGSELSSTNADSE